MIANQVGRRYAEAIYEIAVSSDKVKEIYEALNQMMELYKNCLLYTSPSPRDA